METDLAYDVLADYSLQETPFYEAPTPAAAAGVTFYPEPQHQHQQSDNQQQQRHSFHGSRRNGSAFDLSLTTSMLTGKMQLMNTSGGSVGSGMANHPGGGLHSSSLQHANQQLNHHNHQHQSGMALVPTGVPSAGVHSSALVLPGSGGLTRPKKLKKSVSFLPTFVQVSDRKESTTAAWA
ncbi:AGAP013140-PA-like protein [Anopheles sinensis]|uniref:AGAP013140-PA-like protein n=1 Tax=Anopheles sinensis TaxID=74873 RepID=A0A084W7V0_ANOSI|nr:AGAP013140-PA-like protein [Anopheles sinensis]